MTIRYETRKGRPGYDIRFAVEGIRERRDFPAELRTPAARKRWAEGRATTLLRDGQRKQEVPAPPLRDFAERWMTDHCKAEGLKPSTVDAYERILRLHLYPPIGDVRLDHIGAVQIQKVKLHCAELGERTRAGVLSLLAEILSAAVEWDELIKAPKIELPRYMQPKMEFYDFDEWDRLVAGARAAGPMHLCAVLLAGEAGLRRGEMVALEQGDIDQVAITVQRSEWKGKVGKPKGGKIRRVPMTAQLKAAVAAVRHLRGARLLWRKGGKVKATTIQSFVETACRRAKLPESRNVHKLRHTFCSHLALRGVPVMTIKELAGHADLSTTMRYMHLAGGSLEAGIAALEQRVMGAGRDAGAAGVGKRQ